MRAKTIKKTEQKVNEFLIDRHIELKTSTVMDICAETGQLFDNVKHMKWFREEIRRRLS